MAKAALPDLGQAEGTVMLLAGLVALVAVWYVLKNPGGVAKAGAQAVVGAAGAAAVGVVDGASAAVGIPTTEQTTTDPAVARWLIDNYGYFDASKWSGVPALWDASFMATGSGTPPPAGSPVALAHPTTAGALPLDYGTGTGW